ncbi:MFS transporter [Acidiferrobacter sp.]|uniref:MFS transporter n=1 Tax=Acidiferrobacter sp. TaxID=1872107 RepID=UPI002617D50C|nr:MFS transporter [Acidiferrobacter sp.]
MRRGVVTIYGAGLLQGSAFVLIPALGGILRRAPYDLGNGTYGLLYFPEIAGAIVAALAAGALLMRFGANGLFRLGAAANAAAMALLVGAFFAHGALMIALLLGETLMLGAGFGLTNATINRAATELFGGSATGAVTILNAVIGAATALSPLVLAAFYHALAWVVWPALLGLAWLMLPFLPEPPGGVPEQGGLSAWRRSMLPFAAAVLIYAICEGSFGSWANVLVSVDHHLAATAGALALSLFWGGMTVARFAFGAIDHFIHRRHLYLAAPLGMAACFLVIPALQSAGDFFWAFGLAGAACGVYYPYTMSYGIASHPQEGTQMAGLLVGGLMVGEGIGSFGLGPLQHWLSLAVIYRLSALWALPLVALAWRNSRATAPRGGHA